MAYPTHPASATELLTILPEKFEKARTSGELFFFESQARDVVSSGQRFNVRTCPALLNKEKATKDALNAVRDETSSPDRKRVKVDAGDKTTQNTKEPFKPPYVPELFVGCLEGLDGEDGMSILLNKYSLLPNHILLCPPTSQPQSLPPTPVQLTIAHNILLAASRHPTHPRRLLAFYNGGPGAGASQTWRHLQFVDLSEQAGQRAPVEEWVQGVRTDRMDQAVIHPGLPYLHILHPLPPANSLTFPATEQSSSDMIDFLAPAIMRSLDLAFDALRRHEKDRNGGWNLLMTLDHIHLIPRSSPSYSLPEPRKPLELNSLGYAGMLLVRSDEEKEFLLSTTEKDGGLMTVLERCGIPRSWGEEAIEAMAVQQGHINEEMGRL